jgi:subtilase family serine protease
MGVEYLTPESDALSQQALAQQANAQGITWFAASGDSGAADCSPGPNSNLNSILSVDLPPSTKEPGIIGVPPTTQTWHPP